MKTIPVEQINAMPALIVFEILTALILLTVGILMVNKKMKINDRKKLVASGMVGVLTGLVMVGVFFGVTATVSSMNEAKLHDAVTSAGENFNDEQITKLSKEGVLVVNDNKMVSFSDEGKGYNLTVLDLSANQKEQTDEEKKREQQIKDNDF
jgi:hypothetical protein